MKIYKTIQLIKILGCKRVQYKQLKEGVPVYFWYYRGPVRARLYAKTLCLIVEFCTLQTVDGD